MHKHTHSHTLTLTHSLSVFLSTSLFLSQQVETFISKSRFFSPNPQRKERLEKTKVAFFALKIVQVSGVAGYCTFLTKSQAQWILLWFDSSSEFKNITYKLLLNYKIYINCYIIIHFNAAIIWLVSQIKITLLLKIQWKQNHILYVKIVYKHNMMC